MKINKQTPRKNLKPLLIGASALLVILGATLYYTEKHHITDLIKNPFYHPTTTTSQQTEQATKNDPTTSPSTAKENTQPAPGVNTSQTTDTVPVSTQSTVAITTLNQTDHMVNITAKITNPAASGTCTITFSIVGARPVTRTIQTTNDTCTSAISDQEFSMLGDWKATVNYFANNTQATTTGTVTIK